MISETGVARPGGRRAEVWLALGSLALFVAACAAPALEIYNTNLSSSDVMPGFQGLFMGWIGLVFWQFGWLANPLYLLGLVLLVRRRWTGALTSGILAVLFACDTFALFWQHLPANEGGTGEIKLQHLRAGFYLWAAALVLLPLGAFVLRQRNKSAPIRPGVQLA